MDAHSRPGGAEIQFGMLGPLRVVLGGTEVRLSSPRQRALVAALLVESGSVVSTDLLTELVWGSDPPADPNATIQTHVSRVRSALSTWGGESGRDLLVTAPGGYLLDVPARHVDARRFEQLVGEARRAPDHETTDALVAEALALWRGDPLPELDHRRIDAEVARLQELRLAAIELRVDALLALSRPQEVVAQLEPLVARHPLRERFRGQLMVALYRCGRQADALAHYRDLRDELVGELGVEPSPLLRRLELAILQQAEHLAWPMPAGDGQERSHLSARPRDPSPPPIESLTTFVGRADDVHGVVTTLRRCRVVTLVGVGGVGKSRLAVRVAREVAADYADGVRACDLAVASEPTDVVDVVATTLAALPSEGTAPDDSLLELLASQQLLLVLDNCEHVRAGVSELVDRLARVCPGVDVLATSRHPLGLPGEQTWPVAPLPVAGRDSPAVELFRDRAMAVDPAFELTGERLDAVVEICRRLDGLPLAVELAAARVRSMAPADIVERLEQRFELLTAAAPAVASRHRSLRAVIDWSHSMLSEPTGWLFDRLSVFAGGFDLAAAEHVCAGDGLPAEQVAARLTELVDHSLLIVTRPGDRARYRLLETLRAHGTARLEARGEREAWERRHARYFASLADAAALGAQGPDEPEWVRTVDTELANLRAAQASARRHGDLDLALRLPASLNWYAYQRLRDEIYTWAVRALELPGSSQSPQWAPAMVTAAVGCLQRGDLDRATDLCEQALDAAPEPSFRLRARQLIAEIALYRGDLEAVDRDAAVLVADARSVASPYHEAIGHLLGVLAATYSGRDDVEPRLRMGWRAAQQAGAPSLRAGYWYLEGETRLDTDSGAALAALERSIEIAASVGDRFNEGVARVSIASIAARHGRPREALAAFREIIEHWRTSGDWAHMWTTLHNLVVLLARTGATEPAAVLLGAVETASTGAPAFGDDAHRLQTATATLRDAMGDGAFVDAMRRGRAMTDDEAVVHALARIDDLLDGRAPAPS